MPDMTKYAPINGGNLISDFKIHFSIFRTKIPVFIAFLFIFTAFTIFLAFTPPSSTSSSSPIFTQVFTVTNSNTTDNDDDDSYRSHFSSIYLYFFPNSSSSHFPQPNSGMENRTKNEVGFHKDEVLKQNQTQIEEFHRKNEVLKQNQTQIEEFHRKNEVLKQNQTQIEESHRKNGVLNVNQTETAVTKSSTKVVNSSAVSVIGAVKNLTSNLMKKQRKGIDDLRKSLMNCDFYDGNWVMDNSYPLYKPNSCSLIDEQFNCFFNGRPDSGYYKLKWKPKRCTLPRLNGSHMLEMLRGKRLVFVGDSLNRNMWESLICILRNSAKNKKKVYEASGKQQFRSEVSYSFVFQDYKFTVEFFVTPFLVQEWEVSDKNGTKKETLRLDLITKFADQYKDADIIVFNTGHWWTHDKTSKGQDYYQEGSHVYEELNVEEAFRKAMTTWGRWIDAKVNPKKSLVFFRGYSASHFSGGQWNSGGQCDNETEPITNDAYLSQYPSKMALLEQVMRGLKTRVTYMNVTKMTDYRKDGHPSLYRKQHSFDLMIQDCSHWCLPGVPDIWNEILYAELLVKLRLK